MILRSLMVALAFVLAACTPTPTPTPEPIATEADFVKVMRGATRLLWAVHPETKEELSICSGVMLTREYFITAAHCDVSDIAKMKVDGRPATKLAKDDKTDVMIMHVAAGCPCVPHVKKAEVDELVYAVGYPVSEDFTPDVQVLTEGRAQGVNENGDLLFTAPVTWGNSGGGVFAIHEGHVVLVAIVSHGTIVPIGGFIPSVVGHLNYGPAYDSIVTLYFEVLGIK